MDTLDENNNNQISERAIRNLSQSGVWVIIVSSVGIFTGMFILYSAFKLMSNPFGSQQAGIILILALIWISIHVVGLNYGISLNKIKIYNAEDFDKASSKHNVYWIFVGIIYIIWFLLFLMGLASNGGNVFRF